MSPTPAAIARSILLVEDDPDVIRSLARTFERLGWDVFRATTGQEGLRLYETCRPDLVLLDLSLPDLSGMHVLELLVARDATVVMLTGNGDITLAVEAMKIGAENFLSKPVEISHLIATVARATGKAELERRSGLEKVHEQ